MKRRHFLGLLGGVAACPLSVSAQKVPRRVTIGLLGPTTAAVSQQRMVVLLERLRELGWVEGDNLTLEYRWADGRTDRFDDIAEDLVRRKVEVIATWGTATVVAAKRATTTIPIVFALVSDPVGSGFVKSLARPGGNVTGLSTQHIDAAGKRLEILRELVPGLRRLAIMANVGNPVSLIEVREVQQTAHAFGMEVVIAEVGTEDDIAPALAIIAERADAVFVVPEQLFQTARNRLAALSLDRRLPTMHGFKEPVVAGALVSYGPDYLHMFRRTADFIDRVLRGGNPADIPVEQPTKFELVINLKTATALALTVPAALLARADEVIE